MNLTDNDRQRIVAMLIELRIEHRDLDDAITHMNGNPFADRLQMQRMKKRKLKLKDSISRLESMLIPDMDA